MIKKKLPNVPKLNSFKLDFIPQTDKQTNFIKNIKSHIVSFGIGYPGTGKTLIAIACGLEMLLNGQIDKIIITRPTIPSGPEIGYLPGTEEDKMAPFLVPIYDAIYKLLPKIYVDDLIGMGKIEIVSIGFVRGRNFENAFVVVDEAENLDRKSFYLLLTRICEGSKIIFTGDSSQIDLRNPSESGLVDAVQKFYQANDFSVTQFGIEDCRRSRIVKEVIQAYFPESSFSTHHTENTLYKEETEPFVITDPRLPKSRKTHTNGKIAQGL